MALMLSATAALAERVTLDASAVPTAMPATFSTSTWPFNPMPSATVQDWFFSNFEPGLIQVDLGQEVFSKSVSRDDALARAEQVADFLRRVQANGGRVMVSISKIPPWLSSNPDQTSVAAGEGTTVASASPPENLVHWAGFVRDVALRLSGLEQLSFRIGWEPDTKVWQGTEQQFFDYYDVTARALKKVHPTARVGGPGVSDLGPHWRNPDGPPMLAAFLRHVGHSGAPLDFVAIHAFSTSPWASWKMYRGQVSELAAAAGLARDIPIFVGEWADRPDPFSALREQAYIAAYLVANLIGMADAGITDHSYTSLTEQQVDERTEFSGGLGIFTRAMVIRPAGLAFMMVGRMGERRLPVGVQDNTVFALAGQRGQTTTLLIANYVPDETIAIKHYVDRVRAQGILNDRLARAVTGIDDLKSIVLGRKRPTGDAALQSAHDGALKDFNAMRQIWSDGAGTKRKITLDITGLSGRATDMLSVIGIDSEHGIPALSAAAIDRKIAAARRALNDQVMMQTLGGKGFGEGDIQLVRDFARASNKSTYVQALDSVRIRRLISIVGALNGIEQAAGLPAARQALGDPRTGFAVSQSVSIAGKTSLSFDIEMEPNSVVLLEFGG